MNSAIFRAALIVLMIMGIPLIGVLFYLNIQKANVKPAATESESVDPESTQSFSTQPDPIQ